MKRLICVIITIVLLCISLPVANAETETNAPSVSAEAYILYCADNGEIICSKNENKQMKPASTTKLLTTLIALENAEKDNKSVKFTEEMIAEGSSMYLKIGDVVTLSDLAAGMMMASGNDAANAVAISIAGSKEKFAELMNEKAQSIGMKRSHFITPSGLDDENHYSNAYDLALLMSYALKNESFSALTSKKSATVKFKQPSDKQTVYSNHNRLLSLYEPCIGGKTGYTMAAGRCLVSAAEKNGVTLICVTLNDKNDWDDHQNLYEYGFSKLSCYSNPDTNYIIEVPCVGGDSKSITVSGRKDTKIIISPEDNSKIIRKVYCDSFVYAPVRDNQPVGRIDYILNNKVISSTDLISLTSVNSSIEYNIFIKIKEFFKNG